MKKTILPLLALVFCVTISQYSYGQKRKSTKIDSFYYEVPNSQNQFFKANTLISGDSLPVAAYTHYTNSLFNSERTDFSLERRIQLTDNSGSKTIPIDVNEDVQEFILSVNCDLTSGVLNVEIYDPKGVKRGNFSVKGSGHSDNTSGWAEIVGGVINKRYSNPIKGAWSLKFIAEKVSADILISTKIK